jgi:hypothetical protein
MRNITGLFVLVLSLVVVSGAGAGDGSGSCQYVQVVDHCREDLVVVEVGQQRIIRSVDMSPGLEGLYDISGVAFSTVPGFERQSFVAQGPYLRVMAGNMETVEETVDVGYLIGILDLQLSKATAAPPMAYIDGAGQPAEQWALYAVGTAPGPEAYWIVLDQAAVLAGSGDPGELLLGWGPLCPEGETCAGRAVDVTVGSESTGEIGQQAFVTALDDEAGGGMRQIFYELTREAEPSGPWTVSRTDWDDLTWDGWAHRTIGLDFEDRGPAAYGVLQTGGQVVRLDDPDLLCDLPGEPTDVVVWGSAAGLAADNYLFVTYRQGTDSYLAAFPAGACPGDPLPSVMTVPVGSGPTSLAVSSSESETFWVFTTNRYDGTLTTLRFRLWNDGNQDHLDLEEQGTIDLAPEPPGDTCPTHLAIEVDEAGPCEVVGPAPTSPPDTGCLDEDDPDCSGGGSIAVRGGR